jgi:hypothetical protein
LNAGSKESLPLATEADLDSVKEQFEHVLGNSGEVTLDCLFSGNVSSEEAKKFFFTANSRTKKHKSCRIVDRSIPQNSLFQVFQVRNSEDRTSWSMTAVTHIIFSLLVAGNVERRVGSGEDIELHFTSKNP